MASTAIICETNGIIPGTTTENIPNISWKAVDDTKTVYSASSAAIRLATNSYLTYTYFKFIGVFNSLGSVRVTNVTGIPLRGVTLWSTPSIYNDSSKVPYATPTRLRNNLFTSANITAQNSFIDLVVGPLVTGFTGPLSPGKTVTRDYDANGLYSNYLVTQIQVASNADVGNLSNIVLELTYNEY